MPTRYCPPVLGGRGRSPEGVKIIDYKKADTQQMSVCQFFYEIDYNIWHKT